jgi:hypothetical protein
MCCDRRASETTGGAAALPSDWEPRDAVRYRARHGGSDRPSAGAADLRPGLDGKEHAASLDARSRTRRWGLQRSRSPIPRAAWWRRPSKRRAAVGGDRAGRSSRPMQQVTAIRARAWTPCSSLSPRAARRCEDGCICDPVLVAGLQARDDIAATIGRSAAGSGDGARGCGAVQGRPVRAWRRAVALFPGRAPDVASADTVILQ